jgi:hypothetical protein
MSLAQPHEPSTCLNPVCNHQNASTSNQPQQPAAPSTAGSSDHATRSAGQFEDYCLARPTLYKELIKRQAPPATTVQCMEPNCNNEAKVCCKECRPYGDHYLCAGHDRAAHLWAHTHPRRRFDNRFLEAIPSSLQFSDTGAEFTECTCHGTTKTHYMW